MNHASFFGILSSACGSPKVRCEYVYMHTYTLTLLHVCLNEELLSCQLQSCCLRHINFRYYEHIQTLIALCPAGVCPCFKETPCRTAEFPLQVLDYIPPGKFHQLARMCSIQGDTVHYGYSMNWVAPWLEQNEGILWEGPSWTWKHFGYCNAAHMIWLTALVWQHLGWCSLALVVIACFISHHILYGCLIHVGMWFTVQHPHRYRAVSSQWIIFGNSRANEIELGIDPKPW